MSKSPCYGCAERYVGCHANCEAYSDFREVYDKEMQTIRTAKEKNSARQGYISDKQFANAIKNRKVKVFKQTKK